MWFLAQAPSLTRGSNLIVITFVSSYSDHFCIFRFFFFLGLHMNSKQPYVMFRLKYGWGKSYRLGIVHSWFILAPAETAISPLTRHQSLSLPTSSLGLEFPGGLWSTDKLNILCCILSSWSGLLVHTLSLSRVIDNWVRCVRPLWLDIPHSHLFTNASCPETRELC